MSIKKIGVIGMGTMGRGIIQTLLNNNYNVLGINLNTKTFENNSNIMKNILNKNKINDNNLNLTTNLSDIQHCDLLIESIIEDKDSKIQLIKDTNKYIKDSTIFATNTSSLSINELKNYSVFKENFLGIHFFNPVPKMKLVEIISSDLTSKHTINKTINIINEINYKPILCKDSPGFIVNKLLIPQIIQAIQLYINKNANIEDIDAAIKIGLGHPMGPLKLSDYIGNDVVLEIFNNISTKEDLESYKESIKQLEIMVLENKLGKKTGEGFYKW